MIKDLLEANETVSANALEIEKLKRALPQCFDKEGNFKMNTFQELLKGKVSVYNEGYELKFLGKSYGRLLAALHTTTVMEPDLAHNGKEENKNSENVYVSGDNLDALKHLLKSYEGSIKAIYIDPPYNTGSDGFVYNDKFTFTRVQLEEKLDVSPEEAERILEMTRRGSASHSAWLTFMYPRLLLARDLLSEDGVIFISIDDNEQANLKMLCDSIFGEENFVSQIIVQSNKRGRTYKEISQTHEYLLIYTKSELSELNEIPKDEDNNDLNLTDDIGKFNIRELRNRNPKFGKFNRPNLFFPIYVDPNKVDKDGFSPVFLTKDKNNYIEVVPLNSEGKESCWRWSKNLILKNVNENTLSSEIVARKKSSGGYNIYEKYRKTTFKPKSIWDEVGVITEQGTVELKEVNLSQAFDFPKPLTLIKKIIQIGMDNDDIILDFFSGSGTTAQAVMELNAQDNGARKFIMVQWQEETKENSTARKEGYATIDQIGMERIRRAAEKIRKEHPDTTADLGFKHYTLREPENDLLAQLEEFTPDTVLAEEPDHILKQFGVPTVITTWLLRDGYGFNAPVQQLDLAGYEAWLCEKHLYLIGEGFSIEAMKALYEKYDTDDTFAVENIIIFGYSFTWTEAQMIKNNLFKIKADDNINRLVNLEIRY